MRKTVNGTKTIKIYDKALSYLITKNTRNKIRHKKMPQYPSNFFLQYFLTFDDISVPESKQT